MFTTNKKIPGHAASRLALGLALTALTALTGCGRSQSELAELAVPDQLKNLFTDYQKTFDAPQTKTALKAVSATNFQDLYTAVISASSDAPHAIGPYKFSGELSMAKTLKSDYAQMQKTYGNMHQYLATMGVSEAREVNLLDYNKGLILLEKSEQAFVKHQNINLSPDDTALVLKAKLVTAALEVSRSTKGAALLGCIFGCITNNITMNDPAVQIGLANGMANGNGSHNGNDNNIGNGNFAGNASNNGSDNGSNNANGNLAHNGSENGNNNANGNGANNANGLKVENIGNGGHSAGTSTNANSGTQTGSSGGQSQTASKPKTVTSCPGGTPQDNGLIMDGSSAAGCVESY